MENTIKNTIKNAKELIDSRRPASDLGYVAFELRKGTSLLLNPKFVFTDREGNRIRVRYLRGFNSIFVDEQQLTEEVKLEYISLETQNTTRSRQLIDFLLLHPGFGSLYNLIDPAGEARREISRIEVFDDLWDRVRALELQRLKSVNLMLTNLALTQINQMSEAELRLNIRTIISRNPESVAEALDDPVLDTLYLYHLGTELGLVKYSPVRGAVLWTDSNEELVKIPVNKDPGLYTAKMLLTDDLLKARELLEGRIHD